MITCIVLFITRIVGYNSLYLLCLIWGCLPEMRRGQRWQRCLVLDGDALFFATEETSPRCASRVPMISTRTLKLFLAIFIEPWFPCLVHVSQCACCLLYSFPLSKMSKHRCITSDWTLFSEFSILFTKYLYTSLKNEFIKLKNWSYVINLEKNNGIMK